MQASSSPPSRLMRLAIYMALVCIAVPGLAAIYSLIVYNPARGDEFFSFVENYDCGLGQLMQDVKQGLDVSYLHAATLWLGFKLFGHTLYVQRSLSFLFYTGALSHLYFLFRALYKNNILAWLLVTSVYFCNLGLFIAADGRFYAMLLYACAAYMHYLVNRWSKGKKLSIWLLIIIQLLGLLVSAQFMMLQALVMASIMISWIFNTDKVFVKRQLIPISLSAALSIIVYLVFFRIQFFTGFQVSAMFQDHHETFSQVVMDSLENLLRWLLLPDNYWVMAFMAFIILRVGLYLAANRKIAGIIPSLQTFCIILGIAMPIIFFIKIGLCNIAGSYYIWPARYYTPVFFLIAFLTAYFYRALLSFKTGTILLLIYLLICIWGSYDYYRRYNAYAVEKASFQALVEKLQTSQAPIIVCQSSENSTEEIQFYSALYCFHMELAGWLQLYYDGGDKFRKQFMQTLQKKRPQAHVYTSPLPSSTDSVTLNKNTYYIVNKRDKRFQEFEQNQITGSNMKLIYIQ